MEKVHMNKNYNRNKYKGHDRNKTPKPLPIGSTVFVHVTYPKNTRTIYLCEARIVRQPRYRDDQRYKVVIIKAQTFAKETDNILSRLIGMKIVRQLSSLSTEKSWKYSSEGVWIGMKEKEADQITFRTINNIKKDITRQKKHSLFPRLD